MRILVDFLPVLPRGGGLQNSRNLWSAIRSWGGDHAWLAVARPGLGLEPAPGDGAELTPVEPGSMPARLWAENARIPALARRWGADVVWTPMGAGPLRSGVPRVMGWHDSSLAYPEVPLADDLGPGERLQEVLRGAVARRAARSAAAITVQTPVMRRRLARVWSIEESRFHVVPNGPSRFLEGEPPAPERPAGPPTILVVAEAKPAKNLGIVPWVARELRAAGAPGNLRIVLTVPGRGGAYADLLEDALTEAGPGVPIERIGRVPHAELGNLYRRASAVFLPSLCESFSATWVEAMHFGVPLVTSDRDFAREACGDAALYADPRDAGACARALRLALDDPPTRRRLREAGFARLDRFPDWRTRLRLYLGALAAAVRAPAPRGAAHPAGTRA